MAVSIFVAGTGQHSGKTLVSLGLVAALTQCGYRVHYMKPVGQRAVRMGADLVDEDVALINKVYNLPTPPRAGNPVTIPSGYTRQFLMGAHESEPLMEEIRHSYQVIARDADIVVIEGTYKLTSQISDLVAKIMPRDEEKLRVAEELVADCIDMDLIVQAIFSDQPHCNLGPIVNHPGL